MYKVSSSLYDEAARRLVDSVGDAGYFSGSLEFDFGDVSCRLTVSVVVYRRRERRPEGDFVVVYDMVPVWWEFHTYDGGGETLNDFSFSALRERFA